MLSSMLCRAVAAVVAATVLGGGILFAPASAASAAPRCAAPGASAVIAETPWAQQRYDLVALGQITDGSGVPVAVLDSGVDAHHPQLRGAVRAGADELARTDGREDCRGHGTAVASVIAARPVPGSGLRGLAPGATILPIRVNERISSSGEPEDAGAGDVQDLADGVAAAVAMGASVINLSVSTTRDDPTLRAAIQRALDADVVVVAAVGNAHDRGDPAPYPASYDGVVGVGAIAPDGIRLAASPVGSYVDIVAPGDRIVAAAPSGGHAVYQGTSFAAPFVAATAALIRSRWPALPQAEVVRRLLATADPAPGSAQEYGRGVLNPLRALTEVLPPATAAAELAPAPVVIASSRAPAAAPIAALAAAALLLLLAAAAATVSAALNTQKSPRS
jgi:membrane-anchored mycosin MYCP